MRGSRHVPTTNTQDTTHNTNTTPTHNITNTQHLPTPQHHQRQTNKDPGGGQRQGQAVPPLHVQDGVAAALQDLRGVGGDTAGDAQEGAGRRRRRDDAVRAVHLFVPSLCPAHVFFCEAARKQSLCHSNPLAHSLVHSSSNNNNNNDDDALGIFSGTGPSSASGRTPARPPMSADCSSTATGPYCPTARATSTHACWC